jgi:hypothetical protein
MQKSTEERLADIESGITRLTKMQRCVFDMLLFLRKASVLGERAEQAFTSFEDSRGAFHRREDRGIVLLFGGVALVSLAISIYLLFSDTPDSGLRVAFLVFFFMALALMLFSVWELYRALRQHGAAQKTLIQTKEALERVREDEPAVNETLAQVLDEWNKLTVALNDVVNKSGNSTPGPRDSQDKS